MAKMEALIGIEVVKAEIAKLELKRGDTLVIKVPGRHILKIQDHIQENIVKKLNVKCLVIPKEFDLEVLTREDA